jgi:hypothetical protein
MRYQLALQLPFNSKALEQLTAGYRDFDEGAFVQSIRKAASVFPLNSYISMRATAK